MRKEEETITDFDLFEDFRDEEFLNKCYSAGDIHEGFNFKERDSIGFYDDMISPSANDDCYNKRMEERKEKIKNIEKEIDKINILLSNIKADIADIDNEIKKLNNTRFKYLDIKAEVNRIANIVVITKKPYHYADFRDSIVQKILSIPEYKEKYDELKWNESFTVVIPDRKKISSKEEFVELYDEYLKIEEQFQLSLEMNTRFSNIKREKEKIKYDLECQIKDLQKSKKEIQNNIRYIGVKHTKSSIYDIYYDAVDPLDILNTIESFGVIKGCKL